MRTLDGLSTLWPKCGQKFLAITFLLNFCHTNCFVSEFEIWLSRFNRPLMSAFCLQHATFPWANSRDAISPLSMLHAPAFLHIQHQSTHSQFQYTYFNTSNPALDLSFHRHAVMSCHRNSSSNRAHVPCGNIFLLGNPPPPRPNTELGRPTLFSSPFTTLGPPTPWPFMSSGSSPTFTYSSKVLLSTTPGAPRHHLTDHPRAQPWYRSLQDCP